MTDVWSDRAEMYRTSEAHREGPDLDLLVDWAAGAERRSTSQRVVATSPTGCVTRDSRS